MIRKLTNISDLSKVHHELNILKKILTYPDEDLRPIIDDHIVELEQKEFLLKKYPPRDYLTIMRDLKAMEEKEMKEIEMGLLKKFPGKDIDTILKNFADTLPDPEV